MTKSEAKSLRNYYITHPTEAKELIEALWPMIADKIEKLSNGVSIGMVASKMDGQMPSAAHAEVSSEAEVWMKLKAVGTQLSVSPGWVRDRLQLLPECYKRRSKSGRGKPAWMLHPETVNILRTMI